MPFASEYDDVFFVAMTHAARSVNAACERIDKEDFVGDIVGEILRRVRGSAAVIADLSESRPNVLYEVGYAHALGIPTVHICSTPLEQLPFDVSHWNTIKYAKGQTVRLKAGLTRRLRTVLGGATKSA
jgi:nucleoside 2-deoxyribosyltransferase